MNNEFIQKLNSFFNFNLEDLDNKIVSYKENFNLNSNKLLDLIESDFVFFVPLNILNNNINNIRKYLKAYIDILKEQDIKSVYKEILKWLKIISEQIKKNKKIKKIFIVSTKKKKKKIAIFILRKNSYSYSILNFSINITKYIKKDNSINLNNKKNKIQIHLVERAGITDIYIEVNKKKKLIAKYINVVYFYLIKNILNDNK